jgi:hypothetical protein
VTQVGRRPSDDWNRFSAAAGVRTPFEPPSAPPPLALVVAGAALLVLLALNELRCRRLELPAPRRREVAA